MPRVILALLLSLQTSVVCSQDLEAFECTPQWLSLVEQSIPSTPEVTPFRARNLLVFSLHTGFEHWAIPHVDAVIGLLARKTGAASVTYSQDIRDFETARLRAFDAVVLNNTCPERDHRNIFYDVFRKDSLMEDAARWEQAAVLEENLLAYVRNGGGIVLLHGGTTMQLNSESFSEMAGGSFDFHPPQQPMRVRIVEPGHPITKGFQNQEFTLTDEPYFFKNAYPKKDFRPLLAMDARELKGLEQPVEDPLRYIAWIKPYGKGRVFVSAPSHNAHQLEDPEFLGFLLNGIQYALGDLPADDGKPQGN
ncbi:ThuA domain-containing protein [Robiginitalea sediminis]|uniref:ThuA domain-containing protein n=1 Tax=Robiginitalea sediminis TaxID=1982593 RepID=UPI000B4ADC2B|nr:ThuA domain-containing protein [Robiginitalea sediminis]